MFETVVPETVAKRSKKLFYESLPVSVGLHALAAMSVLIATVWNVGFPANSPRLLRSYFLTEIPVPPPPPPPPPAPTHKTVTTPVTTQVPVVLPDMAPTIIPDTIPEVLPMTQSFTQVLPVNAIPADYGVAGGVEGGSPGGVVGGDIGGVQGGVIGGVGEPPDDGRVHIARDKPLPLHPVSQVYPKYPEQARLRGVEDQLVVRYVIGKDGRVKEVIVVSHAGKPYFDEAAVNAIRSWRFRPMLKDGQPTEVVHELTVNFRLE